MISVAAILVDLGAALRSAGRPWYVFGAQAVVLYGVPRTTADIDITVLCAAEELGSVLDALRARGVVERFPGAAALARTSGVVPLVHEASTMEVDLVLGVTGLEALFAGRLVQCPIGGAEVPLLRIEDLVVTKVLAGRPRDLEDAHGLVARHLQTMDVAGARALLAEVEEALDQSDLVPAFDAIVQSVRRRRA